MENQFYPESNNQEGDIIVTPQAKAFLSETAKWAKFLAILGFIGLVFLVIMSFFIGAIFSSAYGSMGPGTPTWMFTAAYLIVAALYVMPLYFLYQFSSKTRAAIDSNDTVTMTEALGYLKSHYKYIGILMIVLMALYALLFIFALIGGIASGVSSI